LTCQKSRTACCRTFTGPSTAALAGSGDRGDPDLRIVTTKVCAGLPSDRRLSILVDSAIKAGAPADYVDWLRDRPSNPPPASVLTTGAPASGGGARR
jgi:hypothetical protein